MPDPAPAPTESGCVGAIFGLSILQSFAIAIMYWVFGVEWPTWLLIAGGVGTAVLLLVAFWADSKATPSDGPAPPTNQP